MPGGAMPWRWRAGGRRRRREVRAGGPRRPCPPTPAARPASAWTARRASRGLRRALGVLAVTLALGAGVARAGTLWSVSPGPVELRPGERIVGFELTVSAGRIAALPRVPVGWSVTVDNYPTWRTHAAGSILIGVAALAPADLEDFVVVEAFGPEAGRFDVELVLTVTADFQEERSLHLPRERLGLRRR